MANFELKLPKMGESVAEATINTWLKEIGDRVEADESVIEISTDKVDSDVPSEVGGILIEKKFEVDDVVQVGQTFAIIQTDDGSNNTNQNTAKRQLDTPKIEPPLNSDFVTKIENSVTEAQSITTPLSSSGSRFYSPLVKNIAKKEGISQSELDHISGSGKNGRVTKNDILAHLENRADNPSTETLQTPQNSIPTPQFSASVKRGNDEIIEMTRMGKLISKHMINSVQTSAHVQSFIEVDVTKIWNWRQNIKDRFEQQTEEKITLTPIFMEAVAKALTIHPLMNISVEGESIIKRKAINLGMATALADGNLIVPVIKNADQLNLMGMTKRVNDLANRARNNQLSPDDIQDGTYTVTNVGSFGSIMGTPIINQPQVGILALGAIRKVPAVIETSQGDFIGIRQKMFLSHSYDHRVVNGALGGQFLKTVKDILESWDENRSI